MYQNSLPGVPASIESAQSWVRAITPGHLASLADRAARAVGGLAANAVAVIRVDGTLTFTATYDAAALRVTLSYPWDPERRDRSTAIQAVYPAADSADLHRQEDTLTVKAEVVFRLQHMAAVS